MAVCVPMAVLCLVVAGLSRQVLAQCLFDDGKVFRVAGVFPSVVGQCLPLRPGHAANLREAFVDVGLTGDDVELPGANIGCFNDVLQALAKRESRK